MKLSSVIHAIETFAPPVLQESYDNAGLITGSPDMEVNAALLCLDSVEEVVDEAIAMKSNLIIAHHPVVFSGLKKLNGKNYVERTIIKAIKNDIAIYAAHTNLDNIEQGVNQKIAEKLGLKNTRILLPKSGMLKKLYTFCPTEHTEKVRSALFEAGAGNIGNYSECSFNSEGTGTFKAGEGTNPFVGKQNKQHHEKEIKIEMIFPAWNEHAIVKALMKSHPYEEVAYDIVLLSNSFASVGSGMTGEPEKEMNENDFLSLVKKQMKAKCIRHTRLLNRKVRKVAICGGSGSFLLQDAIKAGADVLVTADFKYHQFFDAEDKIVICDIGHYESEQFTLELFRDILNKNFPTFATSFSKVNTNPINYF